MLPVHKHLIQIQWTKTIDERSPSLIEIMLKSNGKFLGARTSTLWTSLHRNYTCSALCRCMSTIYLSEYIQKDNILVKHRKILPNPAVSTVCETSNLKQ
jgi:hypothetical protein